MASPRSEAIVHAAALEPPALAAYHPRSGTSSEVSSTLLRQSRHPSSRLLSPLCIDNRLKR